MTYIIERDIPVPPKAFGVRKSGKWKQLAEKMQIGDSVELEKQSEVKALYAALRNINKRGIQRKINGKLRVWRAE
jgi:hypothetical protein